MDVTVHDACVQTSNVISKNNDKQTIYRNTCF